MRHWFLFTAALAAALAAPAGAHPLGVSTNSLEDPTFGNVHLYAPAGTPKAMIMLLSDGNGFGSEERILAHSLRLRGNLVVGLDWPASRRGGVNHLSMTCADF